jgi:CHAT domain-containing protein/tetratricopeptide (TPR) repeat protein
VRLPLRSRAGAVRAADVRRRRLSVSALAITILAPAGPSSRALVAVSPQDVGALVDAGRYQEAEAAARARYTAAAAADGPASVSAIRAAVVLGDALVRNGRAADPDTTALAQRTASDASRLGAAFRADLIASLHLQGVVHTERGEFASAIQTHQRALAARRQMLPAGDATIAASLEYLAAPLILSERFAEATTSLRQARDLLRNATNNDIGLARLLVLEAMLGRYDGHYAPALAAVEQALAIRETVTPDHPDLVAILQLKGELQRFVGDNEAAESTWRRALALEDRLLRPLHPLRAITLRWLSVTARARGDLEASRLLLDEAVDAGEKSLAQCHRESTALIGDSALARAYEGDYTRASELYARSFAIKKRCFGLNHSSTATDLHNWAILRADMGQFEEAERTQRQAIGIWAAVLGANHPYVARGLDALAQVLARQRRFAEARATYERSLAIRMRTLGPQHPDVAWTLTNIAEILQSAGALSLARERADQALAIYARSGPGDEPDYRAHTLLLKGAILLRSGQPGADAVFAEALEARRQVFGPSHPLTAEAETAVATTTFENGQDDDALRAALDAEAVGRDHLRFTIRYLPERQALAYAERRPRGLDLALSILAGDHAPDGGGVFDAVIRSRGVVLDEIAARARSGLRLDPARSAALQSARERFATLMLRSITGEEEVTPGLLNEARQRKEDAERELAGIRATAGSDPERAPESLDAIQRALPPGAVLVSFVRYDRTQFAILDGRRTVRVAPSYLAFVVTPSSLAAVPLGSANVIDAQIEEWRDQARGAHIRAAAAVESEREYRRAGARLRQRVWDPLGLRVSSASLVFIVPDGALTLVNVAALPGADGAYLVERGPLIHYLATERDLLGTDADRETARGLIAVGGPAFDGTQPKPRAATRGNCDAVGPLHFDDLPEARIEARDIARTFADTGADNAPPVVLSGAAATKRTVVAQLPGHRVVHLATHGFFLASPCGPAAAGTRSVGGISVAASAPAAAGLTNPLLLSGLALAGANATSGAGANDSSGILTAEEIASLNLRGTSWAVLSACDTGIGEVRAGEGVLGLRRAFQIAGARTIIMSLWQVEDASTRAWMRALYDAHFRRHLGTAESVRAASLQLLSARRARGESTHPFHWAAFVAAGDWQ